MAKLKIEEFDRSQLLEIIDDLQKKLSKKKLDLAKSKSKVADYRRKLQKMKGIISYQRSRILLWYSGGESAANS